MTMKGTKRSSSSSSVFPALSLEFTMFGEMFVFFFFRVRYDGCVD